MYRRNRRASASFERKKIKRFESFETELAKEANKVDVFYKSRQDKFFSRLNELNHQIELMKSGATVVPKEINALQKAYHDNHLHWKLLRKFQETNKYGFLKILKVHDSTLKTNQFDYFLETYLQNTSFWDSKVLEETVIETKSVYTKYFAASDERLAKSELRRSDAKRSTLNLFFVALFLGAIVSLFIVCLFAWIYHYPSDPPSSSEVGWFVYRICLLPILLGILFSLSTYLWEKQNINYVFIFKFNPLHYRSPMMYLKYSLCLFSLWLLSFFLYLDSVVRDAKEFYGLIHPLLFVIVVFVAFILPFPILGHHTRYYLIREISRVLRAGLPGRINVSFADFIMAIKLIALSEFLFDFQIMFCMFGLRDDDLCEDKAYALPFLSALPHWCRMFQCVRRWRQTEHHWILYLWLGLNSVFSVIRWYLDILIDWDFVKFGFKIFTLRKQRLYRTWIYYFVMADNLFLRFVWLIVYSLRTSAKLDLSHPILLVFLSTFELMWGFQFVFFRMESEHFNCRDRYDIIHDVPLPFTKTYEALARENTIKKLKREKRLHRSCVSKIHAWWNSMPWVNSRHKLRESIARAIDEVEREHPRTRKPTVSNNSNNSKLSKLSKLSDSSKSEHRGPAPSPNLSPVMSFSVPPRVSLRLTSSPHMMKHSPSVSANSSSPSSSSSSSIAFHSPLAFSNFVPSTPAHTPLHSPLHSPHHSPKNSPKHSPENSPPSSPPLSPRPSPPPSPTISPHLPPIRVTTAIIPSSSSSPSISSLESSSSSSLSSSSMPRSTSLLNLRRPSLRQSSEYIPLNPLSEINENENDNEDDDNNGDREQFID